MEPSVQEVINEARKNMCRAYVPFIEPHFKAFENDVLPLLVDENDTRRVTDALVFLRWLCRGTPNPLNPIP